MKYVYVFVMWIQQTLAKWFSCIRYLWTHPSSQDIEEEGQPVLFPPRRGQEPLLQPYRPTSVLGVRWGILRSEKHVSSPWGSLCLSTGLHKTNLQWMQAGCPPLSHWLPPHHPRAPVPSGMVPGTSGTISERIKWHAWLPKQLGTLKPPNYICLCFKQQRKTA